MTQENPPLDDMPNIDAECLRPTQRKTLAVMQVCGGSQS